MFLLKGENIGLLFKYNIIENRLNFKWFEFLEGVN